MTTQPYGYFAACWIALEDIHPDSGPLLYAPGSHWFPFMDAGVVAAKAPPGSRFQRSRGGLAETLCWSERNLPTERFIAKKGDVLLWHANLAHGGAPIEDPTRSRLSMACHYPAQGVRYYHDLSGIARDPADMLYFTNRPYLPEYYDDEGRFAPTRKIWGERTQKAST